MLKASGIPIEHFYAQQDDVDPDDPMFDGRRVDQGTG